MLDSMPPHGPVDDWTVDTQVTSQRAEETRQLATSGFKAHNVSTLAGRTFADGTFILNWETGCGSGPRYDAAALARTS